MPQEYDARVNMHLDVNNGLERYLQSQKLYNGLN